MDPSPFRNLPIEDYLILDPIVLVTEAKGNLNHEVVNFSYFTCLFYLKLCFQIFLLRRWVISLQEALVKERETSEALRNELMVQSLGLNNMNLQ